MAIHALMAFTPKRNNCGTQPILPPPQKPLSKSAEREVMRLTAENFGGCRLIARAVGISHTSVLRIWVRNRINRKLIATRNAFVEANTPLALRIAKSVAFDLPPHMREDLSSVALAELTKLAAAYDPARGVPFGAFAQQRIRGACIDSIRRRHWQAANGVELSVEAAEYRADAVNTERDVIERQSVEHSRAGMASRFLRLPTRHAIIAWLHYLEERSIEKIAVDLGVGASRVSQLHSEALVMMREAK